MIGTSDQSCWLAEACKILLLLLLAVNPINLYRNAVRRFGSPDCLRNTIIACPLIPQLWPPEQSERRLLCEKRLPAFKLPPPVVPELRKC